jgi:ABC-type nitrate/sulfonate/bicarbonate transport system substrate-binding protein
MDNLKIALDWTPNINHIGFYVAKAKGFYKDLGINLDIIDTSIDNYKVTPAKKVERGIVDFALCPIESIISYQRKTKPFPLIAVAAILQDDLSAIAVKNKTKIMSPKDLDGKIYSSYKARYEDGIVKAMIKNDGGSGDCHIIYPEKLGIWENLISGKSDATWIFLNWEGIEAEQKGYDLKFFKLSDYSIPYSYSPVIAANEEKTETRHETYRNFLEATKKGYLYCQDNQSEAVNILSKYVFEEDKHIDLKMALSYTAPHFGNKFIWGKMVPKRVIEFLDWLEEKGLEKDKLEFSDVARIL